MKLHELKIDPDYFEAVKSGKKTFEVRNADREYDEGDILNLKEYMHESGYTGNNITVKVTYILRYCQCLSLPKEWVVMAIKPI